MRHQPDPLALAGAWWIVVGIVAAFFVVASVLLLAFCQACAHRDDVLRPPTRTVRHRRGPWPKA